MLILNIDKTNSPFTMKNNTKTRVLVTGITGFIGAHVAVQLLKRGYAVRGTMRNLQRRDNMMKILKENCGESIDIEFETAELTKAEDWDRAMDGVEYVMHIASPLPFDLKKDENDLIIPAREGTLNVLRAASNHQVKRVVLTSSIAAIGHGHKKNYNTFTEEDWTNVNGGNDVTPYVKSKTIAESEAWNFVKDPEITLELSVINPGYVLGPLLEKDYSDSALWVKKLLDGKIPGLPRINLPLVDVRDVAEMHVWAMEKPEAAGHRFICVNENSTYLDMALSIKAHHPEFRRRITTRILPDFLIKLYCLINKDARSVRYELGHQRIYDNSLARDIFEWKPRSNEEAILSMAESMIRLGVVAN